MTVIQISIIFRLKVIKRNRAFSVLFLCCSLLYPILVTADRSAFVELIHESPTEDTSFRTVKLTGQFTKAGSVGNTKGRLFMLSSKEESDLHRTINNDVTDHHGEWVGVLHYPGASGGTADQQKDTHASVIDRVKTVLMFGASAIIILTLNPNIIKQLDMSQLFSKPVIVSQSLENITNVLALLGRQLRISVKITFNTSMYYPQMFWQLTLWTSCGWSTAQVKGHAVRGFVCLDKEHSTHGKADPSMFWNFFYSAIFLFMMIYISKRRREAEDDDEREWSYCQQAAYALSIMPVRVARSRSPSPKRRHTDDTCAVCLELFTINQEIRTLPCIHEFHTSCIDPWLIKNRTCPLCKYNILRL